MRRRRRWWATRRARRIATSVTVTGVVLTAAGVGVARIVAPAPDAGCTVSAEATTYSLDLEQARQATTVTAAAHRAGLPAHAATVGLAVALQESKLHNLRYGDRDSLGLFQQRPSQGWGTPAQLVAPSYAASAFFAHLTRVPGWATLPVAEAGQRVQHSASGQAYGVWETQARTMARVLTGEVAAGLACRYRTRGPLQSTALRAAAVQELGGSVPTRPATAADGWRLAGWLVGHGQSVGLRTVTYRGQHWTAWSGRWRPDPSAASTLRYG